MATFFLIPSAFSYLRKSMTAISHSWWIPQALRVALLLPLPFLLGVCSQAADPVPPTILGQPATLLGQSEIQPPVLAIRLERGLPTIEWASTRTNTYQLLTRTSLAEATWTTLATLTGDGPTLRWTDERSTPNESFYQVTVTAGNTWARRLQTALNSVRSARSVPGAVAVVLHPTNGLWCGVSGWAERGTTHRVHPQMRYPIASITKTFTAACALQLIEEGKLRLDDPLKNWLPDMPNITNTITIRQLLDHTSGIFNIILPITSPEYFEAITNNTGRVWTPEELLTYVKPPAFAPGTGWQYSNTGYVVLGLVIGRAAQHSLAEEFRARFFDRLELHGSHSSWAEGVEGEMPHGYFDFTFTGSGRSEDIAAHGAPFISYYTSRPGSAGVVSTAEDTARWIRALYGGSVLSPDSLKLMTNVVSKSVDGASAYGMGTQRLRTSKGDFYGHGGGALGFTSQATHSPTRNTTVAVWINENRLDGSIYDVLNALIDAL